MSESALHILNQSLEKHQFKLNFAFPNYTIDKKCCAMITAGNKQFTTFCDTSKYTKEIIPNLTDVIRATFDDFDTKEFWLDGFTEKPSRRNDFIAIFGESIYSDLFAAIHR